MIGKKYSDFLNSIITTSFLTCTILLYIFGNEHFELVSLNKIVLSQATKDGIDIGSRTFLLYRVIFAASIFSFFIHTGLKFLISKFRSHSFDILSPSAIISTIGLMSIYCQIAYGGYLSFVLLSISILLLLYVYGLITFLTLNQNNIVVNTSNFSKILMLGFIMSFVWIFIFYSETSILRLPYLIIFIFFSFNIGALYTFFPSNNRYNGNLTISIMIAGLLIFPAYELFQILESPIIKSFTIFYSILFVTIMIFGVFLVRYSSIAKSQLQKIKACDALAFTVLLLVLIAGSYYPERTQSLEIFELANPANSQMRIFQDGEIPILDFMSSHMLSEEFYGIIYHLFHGYNGSQDFMTYDFLYNFLFYIVVFLFLKKLFSNSIIALLFIVTFPFSFYLFGRHLFWNIIGFVALYRMTRKTKTIDYFLWLILIVLMIIWRLDTGASFLLASSVFVCLCAFINKSSFFNTSMLKGLSYFILFISCVLGVSIFLRSAAYVEDHFRSALAYITTGQAHGTSAISQVYNHHFYLFYFLLPLLGFLSVIFIIYHLYKNEKNLPEKLRYLFFASLYLFLLYFTNFQRGVVRHNFFMETDHQLTSTFYIASLLLVFALLYRKIYHFYQFHFLYLGGFLLLIFTKYFPVFADVPIQKFWDSNYMDHQFNPSKLITQRTIPNLEFNDSYFKKFKSFLDSNIRDDQTFLDFSNNPMLYFYCQREVPSYFCQSLQNSVDDYLQLAYINKAQKDKVPIVVFSNQPKMWGDETDGVSNNIRQYLIAEHIFKHYKPYGIIDNKSIWLDKEIAKPNQIYPPDTSINEVCVYPYKKMAYYIGKYYFKNEVEYLKLLENKTSTISEETSMHLINVPQLADTCGSIYIKLDFDSNENGKEINLKIKDAENKTVGIFTFTTIAGRHSYMIRLSSQYLWHKVTNKKIFLENVSAKQIEFSFFIDTRI